MPTVSHAKHIHKIIEMQLKSNGSAHGTYIPCAKWMHSLLNNEYNNDEWLLSSLNRLEHWAIQCMWYDPSSASSSPSSYLSFSACIVRVHRDAVRWTTILCGIFVLASQCSTHAHAYGSRIKFVPAHRWNDTNAIFFIGKIASLFIAINPLWYLRFEIMYLFSNLPFWFDTAQRCISDSHSRISNRIINNVDNVLCIVSLFYAGVAADHQNHNSINSIKFFFLSLFASLHFIISIVIIF